MEERNEINNEDFFGLLSNPMIPIEEYMRNLAHVGVMQEDAVIGVCKIIQGEINQLRYEIIDRLDAKIAEWEGKEIDGEDGGSLYSLGLRHAVDVVLGRESLDELLNSTDALAEEADESVLPENFNEAPDEDG